LDADIVEAERVEAEAGRRTAQLRTMRENIEQLIQYAAAVNGSGGPATMSGTKSLTDQVVQVFVSHPNDVLDMNAILEHLRQAGSEASVPSIRNAVYYAAGTGGRLNKKGRGRFALKDSSAPDTTGAEVEGTA
jgi:hypothetical protein